MLTCGLLNSRVAVDVRRLLGACLYLQDAFESALEGEEDTAEVRSGRISLFWSARNGFNGSKPNRSFFC